MFGEGDSEANTALYRERLRPLLDVNARRFWDSRNLLGRPRHAYFTDGFYRHGMLGRFIGFAHVMAKAARIDLDTLLTAPTRLARADRSAAPARPAVSFAAGARC